VDIQYPPMQIKSPVRLRRSTLPGVSAPKKDKHLAEASLLLRMSNAEKAELQEAVRLLNDRSVVPGSKVYLGAFVLQVAQNAARKIIGGRVHHITGRSK
jgi:hypothetical protein